MSSLFDRLKERKIVQWALAYGAFSWGLLEVVDLVADPFGGIDALRRALVVLLAFGFLITLVLAWFHAEKGRQRVTAVELGILSALCLGGLAAATVSYRMEGADPGIPANVAVESVLRGPVVAVLPFTNASAGEEGAAFLVDGIHGEVLTNLSRLSGLNAISRTSVMGYQRAGRTVLQIAQDLGATAILEGTIQRAGDLVRINVSLIDALNDVQLWAETYPRTLDPETLFAVQAEIASRIAEALAITLAPGEQSRLSRTPTHDQRAFELFLLGKEAEGLGDRGDRARWAVAADYYEQALERDSLYADAWAALAMVNNNTYWMFTRGDERTPEQVEGVRRAAERAIELDPDLAESHLVLGDYYLNHVHDAAGAMDSFLRTRRLDPDNVLALRGLATLAMHSGDWDAARADLRRASELDPMEGLSQKLTGDVALFTRRYAEADAAYRRSATRFAQNFGAGKIAPEFVGPARIVYKALISLYLAADGNTERALATLHEAIEVTDMDVMAISLMIGDGFPVYPGDHGPALLQIEEVRELLLSEPAFGERLWWTVLPKAWMLRESGEDPTEERRIWGVQANRTLLGGFDGLATEIERRSMAALFFARAGLDNEARTNLARCREIADILLTVTLRLNTEPRWAMTLMELGETEQALDLLEDMMSRPSGISAGLLRVQPEWDPIRDHPRFQALVAER